MDTLSNQSNLPDKLASFLQRQPVILQLCRFAAIGFLNTGLNFIISNLISKFLGVEQGNNLGLISGLGFIVALIQSYYWNKDWAFGQQALNLLQNFLRLVWVGLTGVLAVALVLVGSKVSAPYYFYLGILVIFLLIQFIMWKGFGLSGSSSSDTKNPFLLFFIVSFIGFLINVGIVAKFSVAVHLTSSADLNKNVAFVVATVVSLVWNFIGYKLFVFKK